ncbi:hypothetical protein CFHF_23180 [Caulobacter flavus]|uniref:DUF2269 domain-containing protein n=1 Tax=Caulobacter flavus TaxID=1679497 RepID=A0A2N5CMB1_9CAUL|nr:hypothetical protein C1707_00065 [Caulobacter flavus]PLR07124.1 hypothetical protein CFHF_23180 [Caulobacter flavus]
MRIVIDKLAVLNPLAKLPDEETATRAARAGAVGSWLTAVGSVFGAAMIFLRFETYVGEMRKQILANAAQQDPAVTQAMLNAIGPTTAWATIIFTLVLGLVYLWLGFVQWRRLTRMIPLLMLLLSAYGLLSTLLAYASNKAATNLTSPAQMTVSMAMLAVAVLCFIAGLRGGFRLHALRKAG